MNQIKLKIKKGDEEMYLQKLFAAFKKGGDLISIHDRLFFARYDYVVEIMVEEAIKKGIFPKLTMDEIEIKPVYLIREGERKD